VIERCEGLHPGHLPLRRLPVLVVRATEQVKLGEIDWSFDGTHWTQVQDIGPAPRSAHAVTFDSTRGAVVLFGGDGGTLLGDTWEHNT
jgi:hypothetical protein